MHALLFQLLSLQSTLRSTAYIYIDAHQHSQRAANQNVTCQMVLFASHAFLSSEMVDFGTFSSKGNVFREKQSQ